MNSFEPLQERDANLKMVKAYTEQNNKRNDDNITLSASTGCTASEFSVVTDDVEMDDQFTDD